MSERVSEAGNVLGQIADRVVFENDQIRVWTLKLGPNGHQPWHQHDLPYLVVPLTAGVAEMRWEDGTTRRLVDEIGEVKWRGEPGKPHELYNRADGDMRTILIEVKTAAGA